MMKLEEMDRRLLEAAIKGNTVELRQLRQEDLLILDREMCKCEKEGKDNPLHIAALYGHVDFITEMLSLKWDFTRRLNSQGQSPLHLATARGQVEVVKEILKADPGACFVRDRDGMIPLHLAAIKGRLDVLENLVNANPTTAFVLTERGEPILHLCAKNNQIKALRKLVDSVDSRGFVNLKDNDDNSILHILSARGQAQAIWFLLRKGVLDDVNADNRNGLTPVEILLVNGSVFGLSGFIIMMLLLGAGGVRPKRRKILLMIEGELGRLDGNGTAVTGTSTDASWFVEVLLVVAVLTFTVAFQTGINPPGGFWQSTGDDNGAMHYAGGSVMWSMDPKSYRDFSYLTTVTISASMCFFIMMICRWYSNSFSWFTKLFPVLLTSISICTMVAAYHVALSFLSPEENYAQEGWFRYGSVIVLLALIYFMANIAVFFNLASFAMVWSLKKFKPDLFTTVD